MKRGILLLAAALAACTSPQASGVKVIVGARLIAAPGSAPVEYSVVVVKDGKFSEVGPQSSTPVPKGAEIIRGIGMTIEPAPGGGPIEPGGAADLVLNGGKRRIMRDGQWIE